MKAFLFSHRRPISILTRSKLCARHQVYDPFRSKRRTTRRLLASTTPRCAGLHRCTLLRSSVDSLGAASSATMLLTLIATLDLFLICHRTMTSQFSLCGTSNLPFRLCVTIGFDFASLLWASHRCPLIFFACSTSSTVLTFGALLYSL